MNVQHVPGRDRPKTEKDALKEQLKGKILTQKEKDDLLMQMAKDLGYV